MITKRIKQDCNPCASVPKEGELYKCVTTFGVTFELRYGYYDERERGSTPDVIYPDFIKDPLYTANGEPFATMMQDSCMYYKGNKYRTNDSVCGECEHFCRGEEWLGICRHVKKRKSG